MSHLIIDSRNVPEEGLHLEGSLPASVFELSDKEPIHAKGPLEYALTIFRDEDSLIISGQISALFELQCGRCAEDYLTKIGLNSYGQGVSLQNDRPIDLTSTLREDILLTLPAYPRCETSNVSPRVCPAEGQFKSQQDPLPTEQAESSDKSAWTALDQLNHLKRN